ncbi:nuclear/nucleolar GTPase 2-like isoform X2 [Daucus carota subsp. sativus]|uniref:nuclear/nucleolar GTPase 2-like isoform X2 n=1 Tax=Daucus carota subsp. sativus TaxID=79200 RepID=UPI0007EFCD29|nr:PREDICTED: nuclear/nucleolar GTPase 2-like isoform X2 [Daucus carota subsp. sativus]
MGKNRGKSVNISGKPKHSSDASRTKGSRTAATVRRLKMYNKKPKLDRKGKILKHEFQSKELPSTHIQPDPRWFGNTRVVSQKELELLRDQLQNQNHISNATQVIYVQKGSAKAYATKKVQV